MLVIRRHPNLSSKVIVFKNYPSVVKLRRFGFDGVYYGTHNDSLTMPQDGTMFQTTVGKLNDQFEEKLKRSQFIGQMSRIVLVDLLGPTRDTAMKQVDVDNLLPYLSDPNHDSHWIVESKKVMDIPPDQVQMTLHVILDSVDMNYIRNSLLPFIQPIECRSFEMVDYLDILERGYHLNIDCYDCMTQERFDTVLDAIKASHMFSHLEIVTHTMREFKTISG